MSRIVGLLDTVSNSFLFQAEAVSWVIQPFILCSTGRWDYGNSQPEFLSLFLITPRQLDYFWLLKNVRLKRELHIFWVSPESLGHWSHGSTLSYPRGKLRAEIFSLCWARVVQEREPWYLLVKPLSPLSPMQVDFSKPLRAPRLTRLKPVIRGFPFEKLRCWMHEQTLSLPKEIQELACLFMIAWHYARGDKVSWISGFNDFGILFTWGAGNFQLAFISHSRNLAISCCWIGIFVGIGSVLGFLLCHLTDIISLGIFLGGGEF